MFKSSCFKRVTLNPNRRIETGPTPADARRVVKFMIYLLDAQTGTEGETFWTFWGPEGEAEAMAKLEALVASNPGQKFELACQDEVTWIPARCRNPRTKSEWHKIKTN